MNAMTNEPGQIAVPDVTGKTQAEAQTVLTSAGLVVVVDRLMPLFQVARLVVAQRANMG
jgi:hypothetical protein